MTVEARLLLGSDDAVAGMQERRRWATQGTKAAAVGAPGHEGGRTAGSGHEGDGVACGVACWPTPPLFKKAILSSRRVHCVPFRYYQRIWPFWPSCST